MQAIQPLRLTLRATTATAATTTKQRRANDIIMTFATHVTRLLCYCCCFFLTLYNSYSSSSVVVAFQSRLVAVQHCRHEYQYHARYSSPSLSLLAEKKQCSQGDADATDSDHITRNRWQSTRDLSPFCRSVSAGLAGILCGTVIMTTATTGSTTTLPAAAISWESSDGATLVLTQQQQQQQQQRHQPMLQPPSSYLKSQAMSSSFQLLLADSNNEDEKEPKAAPQSALEEVWTLINKYYIDRSFANQDWNAAKVKYQQALERSINNNNDPSGTEMKLITEMVQSLGDRYSRVLSVDQYSAIQKYDLIGVGATLMPNADKQIMVGAPPIPGSAAARAGLQVGDIIQAVNGQSTDGRTAFDIIDQIAEDPSAKTITLTIRKVRGDNVTPASQAVDVTLDRQFLTIKDPVKYQITEKRSDGTKVGWIRIAEFNALVKPRLENALQDLVAQGANAFVLDLRGNGGGAFQSAVEISSLFVNKQVATYVVDGTTAEIPFSSAADRLMIEPNQPLVIWMDGRTASAAEVLAAALHDNCRATLLGKPSFGKGLIQAVYGLKNGAGLVLTVAKYVTPNHDEIQGIGLKPDAPGMVPGGSLSTLLGQYSADTSGVNFQALSKQLKMCKLPDGPSNTPSASSTSTLTTRPE